jgi:DNA-binding MarR family transcriptional regulator
VGKEIMHLPLLFSIDAPVDSCDTIIMECDSGATDEREVRAALGAWLRLARVFQKIDRASAEQLVAHGLTTAQFDVLSQLGRKEGISQQELANHLLVTKGNISQLIGRMEERGLIFRCHEGRANALFLTEEGKRLRRETVPALEAQIAMQFRPLTTSERRTLLRLLRRLDHGLE